MRSRVPGPGTAATAADISLTRARAADLVLLAYAAWDQARTGTGRDAAAGQAPRLIGDRAILDEDSLNAWAAAAEVLPAADRLDDAQRLAEVSAASSANN